jgi:hypothetical protein
MTDVDELTAVGDDEAAVAEAPESRAEVREENIRSVRIGHGANCSSVGSVIDTLFLGAAVGGAIFAAVCAAMKVESVTVVGGNDAPPSAADASGAKASEVKPDDSEETSAP